MTDEPNKPTPAPVPTSTPAPVISNDTVLIEDKPGDKEPTDSEAK